MLVNFGDGPIETSVGWDTPSGMVEVCQPFEGDRVADLPVRVRLPGQSCAAVVAIDGASRSPGTP